MAKLSSLAGQLDAVLTHQAKADAEVRARFDALNTRIAELEASLGDVEIPQAAQEKLDAVLAGAKALDDLIPDAPAPA